MSETPAQAVQRLRAVLAQDSRSAGAWRALAQALRALGEDEEAAEAEMTAVRATAFEPEMIAIAAAMLDNDLPRAEAGLRQRLRAKPTDVAAIRLMAELAARIGRYADAEKLLRRALELAPGFLAARANLATVLYKQNRFGDAAGVLDEVLAHDPSDPANRNLLAAALSRIGDYDEALRLFEELLVTFVDHPKLWMSYGHLLKTVGRLDESVGAYRHAIAREPGLGEVWWSLANLKTVEFADADVAAMEAALATGELSGDDRFHLHFALGKAYGDRGAAEDSFRHFAAGNALRAAEVRHDPDGVTAQVDKMIATFTPEFFAARAGSGDPSPDPIFVLGLPRAGSTLVEQILSSHSAIEGTMELPDMPAIAAREGRAFARSPRSWLEALAEIDHGRLAELGAEYLERTKIQRKSGKPLFIDKLPNNWAYVGLIHAILPNARIVDARRHPLDCGFSNFRQHFAKGQGFSYDLTHIGRYYADYVRAMDHFDQVLPGRIHRVVHERLLDDPEGEVRALLDYLGLGFEEDCLAFHRNTRAVRTASSEQVRRPINRDGVDQWVAYEKWLDPLKAALGDLTETYASRPA